MTAMSGGLKGSRILVTGGAGFIGSHSAKRLHEEGNFVRIVDTKESEFMKTKYYDEFLKLDLRQYDNCLKVTENIDQVFNFAANMGGIGFITEVGADVMRDNVLINTNMLEASRINGVQKYFFSSSACIYPIFKQTVPDLPGLKESDAYPADPNEFYGWEKLFCEKMCEAYRRDYGLNIMVARYHNVYGPEGTYEGGREKAPASLCRKVAMVDDPGEITIWGDGKQTRSFLYITDCVEATIRLVDKEYHEPLNIGSDRLVTIDQLADLIIGISGKKILKKYDLSKPQGVRGRNADLTLVKKVLNWQPQVSLEEGLRRTYEWILREVQAKRST